MIALLQRASHASIMIDGKPHCSINTGLLVFLGIEKGDQLADGQKLLHKVLNYRVFADNEGRMNHSLRDIAGDLLLVSQFTLAADTSSGLRPGFSVAMPPADAELLYDELLTWVTAQHPHVASGSFGADMKVTLLNDGPVTFILRS